MFQRICYGLLAVDLLLLIAHWLWPEYRWGQGRRSYFYLGNSLTLASWLASMQLVTIVALSMVAFHRERWGQLVASPRTRWIWPTLALIAATISLGEITRALGRLEWLGFPSPGIYERMISAPLYWIAVALLGWFVLARTGWRTTGGLAAWGWIGCWSFGALFALIEAGAAERHEALVDFGKGAGFLLGCTLLMFAVGSYALSPAAAPKKGQREAQTEPVASAFYPTTGWAHTLILIGVAGCTFTIIYLQIVSFQMMTIFGNYITANTVLSIALLGISIGGLIGFFTAERSPLPVMIGASLMLPLTILVAFGASATQLDTPLFASVLMTLPFVACSTVITVALARSESHLVYFIDLVGAAIGAFLVSWAIGAFREESALLLLAAFTLLVAACFILALPTASLRTWLLVPTGVVFLAFVYFGTVNLSKDWLNVVRTHMEERYPELEVLFSRSSFVGRYDVVRTAPGNSTLKTVENGRIIDTVRNWTEEAYAIDPRVPNNLFEDPVILILGLSGDAISKTAKYLTDEVYGIEINPAIVQLQSTEMREMNGASYDGINVVTMDGRTYVEQSERQYDMITLMNAHFAKGYVTGRSASPEYLQTVEAMLTYLEHMTDRGIVNIEEPIGRPHRESQVWKLLLTMREALLQRGSPDPSKHFFVFQWKTRRNNYFQILMKKTPFNAEDLANLRQWLQEVDDLPRLEREAGRQLGPIGAITTVIYAPDETFETNVARMIEGRAEQDFIRAHNLIPITDNKPFPFDVDPARQETKSAYNRTLLMMLLLAPFFGYFLRVHRAELGTALPYVAVVGLTGMGYLLIEVVLIQRYGLFLGSPVVTFSTVLGSMLIFSGLGSLWSGKIGFRGLYLSMAALFVCLLLQLTAIPMLLRASGVTGLFPKVLLAIVSVAPLAFFMGVPFPFVLRTGKERFNDASAAMLFAINAATSALAVPLALNISSAWGMRHVLIVSLVVYAAVAVSLVGAHRPKVQLSANGSAYALLALLLISPWLLSRPVQADGEPSRHEVFALSCGNSHHRQDRVYQGGARDTAIPFEWMFWLVRSPGRTILVDTGFDDPALIERWEIEDYASPVERLAQLDIAPEDVTDVILTHTHWDHIGGLRHFTRAKIWIQESEYQHAISVVGPQDRSSRGVRWGDIEALLAAEREGRVVRVSERRELVPGVTIQLGGAHTPGTQYVMVETRDGQMVLAGDTSYTYWNNTRHVPIGTSVDPQANLATLREMQRIAASPFLILPGHDPRVMRWFPDVDEGIVRIDTQAGLER